jgi:hypothetical protein
MRPSENQAPELCAHQNMGAQTMRLLTIWRGFDEKILLVAVQYNIIITFMTSHLSASSPDTPHGTIPLKGV